MQLPRGRGRGEVSLPEPQWPHSLQLSENHDLSSTASRGKDELRASLWGQKDFGGDDYDEGDTM